jgi:hypothetical protein
MGIKKADSTRSSNDRCVSANVLSFEPCMDWFFQAICQVLMQLAGETENPNLNPLRLHKPRNKGFHAIVPIL